MEEVSANTNMAKAIFESYGRDYLFYFSRLLNRVMVEPDMIQLMLTSRCNIRCKICDVWKQQFTEELTTEEVKSLVDQAIEMGIKMIYFTGGEALLRKDIFELINYASRPGIITTANTNGSFITEEFAKEIVSSKLRNINFSLFKLFIRQFRRVKIKILGKPRQIIKIPHCSASHKKEIFARFIFINTV